VSGMYAPLHPAILRVLRHVARGARRGGLPAAVCGEMAADPVLLPLLVGLGLREFSMTPAAIPVATQVVRAMRVSDTARLASRALKAATVDEVEKVLAESMAEAKST
jgi:phosphoenolpyruvate-protein kinase (PTS system EI component)